MKAFAIAALIVFVMYLPAMIICLVEEYDNDDDI